MVTLASLFDGIGGAPLSAVMHGSEPVWSSEIEPFPIKVTKIRFPNMKHYGDITKINGAEVESVDIIVGGSPCQDLSVAGLRKGLKHSDFGDEETTRSGLFMEQVRIVKEMLDASKLRHQRRSDAQMGGGSNSDNTITKGGVCSVNGADEFIQPRFVVWENVPGALSSNDGEDFRAVIEEFCKIADTTVSIPRSPAGWSNSGSVLGDGFSLSWRTIDAQYWGVPQRRRRIYLVLDLGGQSAPKILFERDGLQGDSAESGSQGQGVAGDAEKSVGATVFSLDSLASNSMKSSNPHSGCHMTDVSKRIDTFDPNPSKNQGGMAIVQPTAIPILNFQGSKGNSVADVSDTMYTLNAMHGHDVHCVMAAGFKGNQGSKAGSVGYEEVAPTVLAGQEGHVFCLQGNGIDRADTAGCNGKGWCEDVSYTLNTIDRPAIVEPVVYDGSSVTSVVNAQNPQSGDPCPTLNTDSRKYLVEPTICQTFSCVGFANYHEEDSDNIIRTNNTVRRLTPLECERLQGYPDGWTNIPGASDSARYKALGNSFAIPCAEFVISGCIEELRRDRNGDPAKEWEEYEGIY